MKRVIINGNPGLRKGGRISLEGEEYVLYSVTRNGDWYGPDEVQLWCIAGTEDEAEVFHHREFIPHFLDVVRVDADDVTVLAERGDITA